MAAVNPAYQAGARIYGSGSSAPTRGTVDPMGYITRGLQAHVSNSRSGLAQAALAKLKHKVTTPGGLTVQQEYSPQSLAPTTPQAAPQAAPNPAIPNINDNLPTAPQYTTKTIAPDGSTTTKKSSTAPAPQKPPAPPVHSTPTGQIYLSLPFDYDLSNERAQAENAFNTGNAQLDAALHALQEGTYQQNRDLTTAQKRDKVTDLGTYAGRGMAYSTGYGQEVANSAQQFMNQHNDLYKGLTSGTHGINIQRLSNKTTFLNLLEGLAREQTERNKAEA